MSNEQLPVMGVDIDDITETDKGESGFTEFMCIVAGVALFAIVMLALFGGLVYYFLLPWLSGFRFS